MKAKLIALANFLKLLDETGSISLSNIAVIVIVTKIALAHEVNLADAGALLTVLSGYHYKRYLKTKEPKQVPVDELKGHIEEIKGQVNALKLQIGVRR